MLCPVLSSSFRLPRFNPLDFCGIKICSGFHGNQFRRTEFCAFFCFFRQVPFPVSTPTIDFVETAFQKCDDIFLGD
ncbi:hypothetical protein TNCT_297821 [Trichonephila clavata]|uniref:Uncharacterized protein n=1 Tax=Trichonephila clavata TaxID=2740835 RepID=A0A8X6JAH2_TRICU|nr:hypothetical protein TNCT_297821 [Trichonephila clavata]